MLAFPSYNYEGSFKLEQVVELKSAYNIQAIGYYQQKTKSISPIPKSY